MAALPDMKAAPMLRSCRPAAPFLRTSLALGAVVSFLHGAALPATEPASVSTLHAAILAKTAAEKEALLAVYRTLHAAPELSLHEEKTAGLLAAQMRVLGFEVTEQVGGWGVVCVLKNGPGKTLLVRTDTDALPVEEKTGLPFSSKVCTTDDLGRDVPVMHACAHDFHMACWLGAARVLVALKDRWTGTLVFIAQPAEEIGAGAAAMLKAGLFERFPKPDLCLALHNLSGMPSGSVGLTSGPAFANSDSVDILVRGMGGHGAMPEKTKDPVVLASQIVLALQNIRSREIPAQEPAVLSIGSIHGGSKHNIIPDEVRLQLTVRSVQDRTRARILESITRIAKGLGIAAGLPEHLLPEVRPASIGIPALHNDPGLTSRLQSVFTELFGKERVLERKPIMGAEDFSRFGLTPDRIPICLFWVGSTPATVLSEAEKLGSEPPGLHSPLFHPDAEVALPVGVSAMSAAVTELLKR